MTNSLADQDSKQSVSTEDEVKFTEILPENPVALNCPYCGAPVLKAGHDYYDWTGETKWTDSDVLHIDALPRDKQKSTYLYWEEGYCYQCAEKHLSIRFKEILARVDEQFTNKYFLENEERGAFINYIATVKGRKWIISRFETERGILLDSRFGPFKESELYDQAKVNLLSAKEIVFKDPIGGRNDH